jgi:hypothetical protein
MLGDPLDNAERLFAKGEDLADAQLDGAALNCFRAAWEVLPEPREEQRPAGRILAAIADSCFYLGQWAACRDAVQHAFRCGADPANPFLRLRLGQALFELGEQQEAEGWLVPAFLSEGPSLFADEDPKYLASFRGRLCPPPGEWPPGWEAEAEQDAAADRPRD